MAALNVVKKFFPKVNKVIDATENAVIEVTKQDAASKAVKQHDACAMAVACKRKFHLDGVIISRTTAYLIKGTQACRFRVPASIAREVVSFDRGAGFDTGVYHLAKIPPHAKLGVKQGGNKPKTNKSKQLRHVTANVRSVLGGVKEE